jgi:hypothetical protein
MIQTRHNNIITMTSFPVDIFIFITSGSLVDCLLHSIIFESESIQFLHACTVLTYQSRLRELTIVSKIEY